MAEIGLMRLFQQLCKQIETSFGPIMLEMPEFAVLLPFVCLPQDLGRCNMHALVHCLFLLTCCISWFVSQVLREHAQILTKLTDDRTAAQVQSCLDQVHEALYSFFNLILFDHAFLNFGSRRLKGMSFCLDKHFLGRVSKKCLKSSHNLC
jgi:hypothetical protein